MIGKIKREGMTLAKARDLPYSWGKYLGMMIEESGGDAAKLAIHGRENERGAYSRIKDWQNSDNVFSTVAEVDRNIEAFIERANYQTNFGISQLSPDQAVYASKAHRDVRDILAEFQSLARTDPSAAAKRCGADLLFQNTPAELNAAMTKIASCNPVLSVTVTASSTKPINDNTRLRCFARVAMYCPAIHLDILQVYPMRNWGSADASRKCVDALEQEVEAHFGSRPTGQTQSGGRNSVTGSTTVVPAPNASRNHRAN